MSVMAYQITSLTIGYSTVYSGANQRSHQNSASLAIVWGIHRWPVNSLHKWPVTRKMFPFDDVIMQRVIFDPAIRDIRRRLMPFSFERMSKCPRFINVCRNLKGILLPCYHYGSFLPCIGLWDETLEELFEKYVVNELVFSNTVYHITSWWRYKDHPCVYMVMYGSLLRILKNTFATFVGYTLKD